MLPQPFFVQRRPAMNRGRAATTADDATHRDDHDVHQEVLAIAVVSRVGQRLEKSADRTDIDEFGHGLLPDSIHRGNGPVRQIRIPTDHQMRQTAEIAHLWRGPWGLVLILASRDEDGHGIPGPLRHDRGRADRTANFARVIKHAAHSHARPT